jgi:hypothetical protein
MALQVAPIDPNEFAAVNALAHQNYAAATPQPAAAGGRRRNLLEALLPAIGATGLGLAAAPFTGGLSLLPTLALVGGASALGGAAGEFGAQRANNEKQDIGSILKEGTISGVLGAGGEAFNALRGARAAAAIPEAARVAEPAAKVGIVEGLGKSLKAGASGYGVGAKVAGEQQLTAAGSDAVENTLKQLKIPATAPETQARVLGNRISGLEKTLTDSYAKAEANITPQEINSLGSNIIDRVTNTGGIPTSAQKYALEEVQKLVKNGTSVQKLWNYTKELARNGVNFGANADAKLAGQEAVNRIILDEARGYLNGAVPGIANVNDLYHGARTAERFILDAARDKGGGLIQRLASSAPVKTIEAKAGAGIETAGKAITKGGTVVAPLATQTIPRAVGGDYPLSSPASTLPAAPATPAVSPTDISTALASAQPKSASPFDPANLNDSIAQIAAHGGTLDDISKFVSIASAINSISGAGGTTPGYSKPNAAQYSQAVAGQQSVDQLIQMLGADPSLVTKGAVPGQNLPVVGSLESSVLGSSQYQALTRNILNAVARINTGANMPASEEEFYRSTYLPQPGDPPATVQAKLANLQAFFKPILNYPGASGGSSDVTDLISALGGAR